MSNREHRFVAAKVASAEDNTTVKPVDLLKAIIDDIESGRIAPTAIALMWIKDNHDRTSISHGWARCGLTWQEELAYLELWKLSELLQRPNENVT